ncbi:MAG: GNAT family N-acetyltransferase [Bacteroidota bacterium]
MSKQQNQPANFQITTATTPEHFATIGRLFVEYQQELGKDLSFQSFDAELQNLPKIYNEARGTLLLLKDLEDDQYVGCVGLKKLGAQSCEMKRLYIQPAYRAKKYGGELARAILAAAKELGYEEMYLDTLEELRAALGLYRKLGFEEIPPYYENPYSGVVFMRKRF